MLEARSGPCQLDTAALRIERGTYKHPRDGKDDTKNDEKNRASIIRSRRSHVAKLDRLPRYPSVNFEEERSERLTSLRSKHGRDQRQTENFVFAVRDIDIL